MSVSSLSGRENPDNLKQTLFPKLAFWKSAQAEGTVHIAKIFVHIKRFPLIGLWLNAFKKTCNKTVRKQKSSCTEGLKHDRINQQQLIFLLDLYAFIGNNQANENRKSIYICAEHTKRLTSAISAFAPRGYVSRLDDGFSVCQTE